MNYTVAVGYRNCEHWLVRLFNSSAVLSGAFLERIKYSAGFFNKYGGMLSAVIAYSAVLLPEPPPLHCVTASPFGEYTLRPCEPFTSSLRFSLYCVPKANISRGLRQKLPPGSPRYPTMYNSEIRAVKDTPEYAIPQFGHRCPDCPVNLRTKGVFLPY